MLVRCATCLRRIGRTPLNRRSDFTRLLDDLDGEGGAESIPQAPHIPFSLPGEAAADSSAALRSSLGFAAAEYQQHGEAAAGESAAEQPSPSPQRLPSLEPADIAAELTLSGSDPAALVQARRDFAFRNHPDRVAPPLRERAARRMQIANALIDEALRAASSGSLEQVGRSG